MKADSDGRRKPEGGRLIIVGAIARKRLNDVIKIRAINRYWQRRERIELKNFCNFFRFSSPANSRQGEMRKLCDGGELLKRASKLSDRNRLPTRARFGVCLRCLLSGRALCLLLTRTTKCCSNSKKLRRKYESNASAFFTDLKNDRLALRLRNFAENRVHDVEEFLP